jgi:uncharacterized protein (DUF58 family)
MADRDWMRQKALDIRGTRWLVAAAVLAAIAILLREPLLLVLAIVLALAAAIARLWWRYGLSEVTYHRHFSTSHAFFGEEIEIELITENAKPLPLVWLNLNDEFPTALELDGVKLEPADKPKVGIFRAFFSVRPYERVRRRYRVRCTTRGHHRFGPATLTTGDPFGFVTREKAVDVVDELIVYPRIAPVTAFGLPAKQPLGDRKAVQPLVEDPMRLDGVRPYTAGDSFRRIHWRASARTGALQSRRYERTADPTIALFLDVNTFEHFWEGFDPALLELAITVTASLAAYAIEDGRQVGLYANGPLSGTAQFVRVPPGRHPAQLSRILEALARLVPSTGVRIEQTLTRESRSLPWGATVVIVTAYFTDGLRRALDRFSRNGHHLVLICCGDAPDLGPNLERRLVTYHVSGEETWHALDQLTLAD